MVIALPPTHRRIPTKYPMRAGAADPQGQHSGAVRLRVDQRLRSADHSLCLRPCYTTHMSRSLYLPAAAFDNPKQCAPDQLMILKVTSQWP